MKKKFKIIDASTGEPYKPPEECFVVMNGGGIFFLVGTHSYYPSIRKLSNILPKYEVIWKS